MNCIFCNIIKGEIPSYTVYEDDVVTVFLDINPNSNGDLLLIPKKHILDMTDMDSHSWNHMLEIIKKMKSLLEEKLEIDGLTLVQNNGSVQEVKHFHWHLTPYYQKPQTLLPIEEIYSKLKEQ